MSELTGFTADIRKIEQRVASNFYDELAEMLAIGMIVECDNGMQGMANGREWCLLPLCNDQEELA